MRFLILALFFFAAEMIPSQAKALDLLGFWQTANGRSQVEVVPCEDSFCARIRWLKVAVYDNGEPLRDRRNSSPELRDRTVVGILILKVAPTGDNLWKGRVYDPERGNTYPAEATFLKPGVLQVTGCALSGLICKSRVWQRIDGITPADGMMQARPDSLLPPKTLHPPKTVQSKQTQH